MKILQLLRSSLLLFSIVILAQSCQLDSQKPLPIISNSAIAFSIEPGQLIDKAGGLEQFGEAISYDIENFISKCDVKQPILLSVGTIYPEFHNFGLYFYANKKSDFSEIFKELSFEPVTIGEVEGYTISSILIEEELKLFLASKGNYIILFGALGYDVNEKMDELGGLLLADAVVGGSLKEMLSGGELDHLDRSDLTKLSGNDIAMIFDNEEIVNIDLTSDIRYGSYFEMFDYLDNLNAKNIEYLKGSSTYLSMNFNAGEIVLDGEISNFENIYTEEITSELFKYFPEKFSNILMAINYKDTEELTVSFESVSLLLGLDEDGIEAIKQSIEAFDGEMMYAVCTESETPELIIAAKVETQKAKSVLDFYDQQTNTFNKFNEDGVYQLSLGGAFNAYCRVIDGVFIISNGVTYITNIEGKDISSSKGAKLLADSYGGLFIDFDSTLESLPESFRQYTGLIPLLNMLDDLEMSSADQTFKLKLTFLDKETNSLKLIIDEIQKY